MDDHLPSGLVLRTARPTDLDQIGALLAERGEPQDALDHRLVVQDPALGWEACAVVVDGDRVVSTATLLDETVRIGDVVVPAGQVELVATDVAYEGRGLVRALMAWAHERSDRRGHLLQVMIGIPYFYRLFGYEYAIDIPRARPLVARRNGGPVAPGARVDWTMRRAVTTDLDALAALQDAAQQVVDVAVPHPVERRRWLLEHEASTTWVLEDRGGVVATARVRTDDDGLLVAEPAARDVAAADALLTALTAPGSPAGGQGAEQGADHIAVVHRHGTVTGMAWAPRLGPPDDRADQYYARVARPERLLDALRPVLHARLVASGRLDPGRDLIVSTFGRHYRIAVGGDGLGPVVVGGTMQGPGAVGGAGVAPDRLPALLLGPHGLAGLARLHPDVYRGPDAAMYEALFPPLTADVLSYYLPW